MLVEKHGVRAFALEGDFGGCEAINRYIHGADGTQGDDLRFYGFDMEQRAYTYRYLLEAVHKANIEAAEFEKMWNSEAGNYADGYTTKIITTVKNQLPSEDAYDAMIFVANATPIEIR